MLKSRKNPAAKALSVLLAVLLLVSSVPLVMVPAAAIEVDEGLQFGEVVFTKTIPASDPEDEDVIIENRIWAVTGYAGDERIVTVPATNSGRPVEYVAEYAFSSTDVTTVFLPDTVRSIGKGAFMGCQYLNTVVVGTDEGICAFGDWAAYSAANEQLGYTIGEGAFAGCGSLRHFAVYTSATTTTSPLLFEAANSFSGCSKVTYYGWGDTNNVKTAYDNSAVTDKVYVDLSLVESKVSGINISPVSSLMAVKEKVALTVSVEPADYTFTYNIYSYSSSDETVVSVDDAGIITAEGNGNATVTVISINNFTATCEITVAERVEGDYGYRYLEDGTVEITAFDASVIGAVSIPNTIAGKKVTSIGEYAFSGCNGITSVTIPSGVKEICNGAFYNCSSLAVVKVADSSELTHIGNSAFYGCSALAFFNIDCNLETIGDAAFRDCSSLVAVILPESVIELGKSAFMGDLALKFVSVKGVSSAFQTNQVYFDSANTGLVIYSPAGSSAITYANAYSISNSSVVDDSESLEWVTDKSSYVTGESYNVTVSASVGGSTVNPYSNVAIATDNRSVVNISGNTVTGASVGTANIYAIAVNGEYIEKQVTVADGVSGDFAYKLTDNMTKAQITAYTNKTAESVTVPDTVNFNGTDITVNAIGFGAFSGSALKNINIGEKVVSLSGGSFDCAYALEEIIVDANNAYYKSVDGVLYNKLGTTLVKYPASKNTEVFAVPSGVLTIGAYAFKDNKNLTDITLPAKLATVGAHGFESMEKIMGITLPSTVTSIEDFAFAYNYSLGYVLIPKATSSIGSYILVASGYTDVGSDFEDAVIYGYSGYYAENYADENDIDFINAALLVNISELRLSSSLLALNLHDTYTLGVSVYPSAASFPRYSFETSDASVVTVDANGLITAVGEGTANVIVKAASGVTAVCAVTVNNDSTVVSSGVTSLYVKLQPDKTVYENGEALDFTGALVYAKYSDGTETRIIDEAGTIAAGVRIRGFDAFKAGNQSVEIIFSECMTTLSVTVEERYVTGITITSDPFVTDYTVDSVLDTEGLVVVATYNNGETDTVEDYNVDTVVPGVAGTYNVEVELDGYTDTFAINVSPAPVTDDEVTSIYVKLQPDKTVYENGEALDFSGGAVYAKYSNDTEVKIINEEGVISAGVRIRGYNAYKAGSQTVEIIFGECTTTVSVTVKERFVTGIEVTSAPYVTDYEVGRTIDTEGLVVTATYNNGETAAITDYEIDTAVPAVAGDYDIEVEFGGYTDTFAITALAATVSDVGVTSIYVKLQPDKLVYENGESLDFAGGAVYAKYDDGTEAKIIDGTGKMVTGVRIRGFNAYKAGNQSVEIIFGECTTTLAVTVNERYATAIDITSAPYITEYVVNKTIDTFGLVVIATYNNGETAEVTDYDVNTVVPSIPGKYNIAVTYGSFSDTFEITVTAAPLTDAGVTGVRVKIQPDKLAYENGEALDFTGAAIYADYDDGTAKKIIDETGTAITGVRVRGYDMYTAGSQTVEIIYGECIATLTVTVAERYVTGIDIVNAPYLTEYIVGSEIDTTGLVVKATYNNGLSENITGYELDKLVPDAPGAFAVEVSYEGYTDTFSITVIDRSLVSLDITLPEKTSYTEGEELDLTGFAAIGVFDNGTTKELSVDRFIFTGFNSSVIGMQTITGTYVTEDGRELSFEFRVTVAARNLTGMEIVTYPDKQVYIVGETLDITGLVVVATYDNNTADILTPAYWYEFENSILSEGENYFNLAYGDFTVSFKVLAQLGKVDGMFTYRVINRDEIEIFKGDVNYTGVLEIPEEIDGRSVTSISKNAFKDCDKISKVVIPTSVTKLGTSAFENCDKLESVELGGITTIPDKAFYACPRLGKVVIPNTVTSIGDYAFARCKKLGEVQIPDSVVAISPTAFDYDDGVTIIADEGSEAANYADEKGMECFSSPLAAGDLNGDGDVTTDDARIALRVAVGLEKISSWKTMYGDIDGDGYITTDDARTILRVATGLETLPA